MNEVIMPQWFELSMICLLQERRHDLAKAGSLRERASLLKSSRQELGQGERCGSR